MKQDFKKIERNKGAAMLIVVVFFLFISLAIIAGLVSPTVREFKSANVNLNSKQSYFLAESGSEDAMYRILKNKTIGSNETLTLGENSSTTSIVTNGNNTKQISSTGDVSSDQRKVNLTLQTGAGIAFNYGLQSGTGGVIMNGGASVIGNIYSNGNINATTGVTISGTAVAAGNGTLTIEASNTTPIPPPSAINFRNASASQDFAQSFVSSSNSPIYKFLFYIKKVGSPSDASVYLVTNNNGSPSTTKISIGSVALSAGQVTTNFGWLEILLPVQPSLTPGNTYWVVIDDSSQNANNYYVIGANNPSGSGAAKTGSYSGSWNATNLAGYFKVYSMQGATSLIGGNNYSTGVYIGDSNTHIGDAWATIVEGATVYGNLYCQIGYYNNKACDTTHGVPSPQPMPYSDANIQDWKDEGAAGGVVVNPAGSTSSSCRQNNNCPCPGNSSSDNSAGNCIVNDINATFGPGKITGNLTVNGGGTLTLTGTVWVVGTITVTGGGNIKLPVNFSQYSATLISDNRVILSGGSYTGSGAPGSYLFVVTTSACPYSGSCSGNSAITVTGGSGTIAVNAQSGDILLNGGIHISAAVGYSMTLEGGASVKYDQGLASPSFSNGPSGAWTVGSWQESQ